MNLKTFMILPVTALVLFSGCSKEDEPSDLLTGKTWRIKQETGLSKGDIYYPEEKTSDYDGDGTEETLLKDAYYVFGEPWSYSALRFNIKEDGGSDTSTLLELDGVLDPYLLYPFKFNDNKDSIYFNGIAYTYSNDGQTLVLRRNEYEAVFEYESGINATDVIGYDTN